MHAGSVVIGAMGGGNRTETLALGDTPNIAARMESLAPNNGGAAVPAAAAPLLLVLTSLLLLQASRSRRRSRAW